MLTLYRDLENIPVLAKAGGIVPMADLSDFTNSVENPKALTVKIFPGQDGEFRLREDAGDTGVDLPENWACTALTWKFGEQASFFIHSATGNTSVIPEKRSWNLEFYAIHQPKQLQVLVDGRQIPVQTAYEKTRSILTVRIPETVVTADIEVRMETVAVCENDTKTRIFDCLYKAEIEYYTKEKLYACVREGKPATELLGILQAMQLPEYLEGALSEILLA